MAVSQRGTRGQFREEQAEIALQTAFLRRTVSVCGVKAQSFSLLGRLDGLGAGVSCSPAADSRPPAREAVGEPRAGTRSVGPAGQEHSQEWTVHADLIPGYYSISGVFSIALLQ